MNAQSATTNATGKPSVLINLDLTFVVVIEGIMAAVSIVQVSSYPSQRQRQSFSQADQLPIQWSIIFIYFIAPCNRIQDSLGFWILRRGFRIQGTGFQSLLVEFEFWIPNVSGIPDSLNCISGSKS